MDCLDKSYKVIGQMAGQNCGWRVAGGGWREK